MTNSLCRLFRYSQPSSSEVDDLFWSYIANSIFIFSFPFPSSWWTMQLPKPLKTLLLSLTVSDLCVGLVLQPLFIAFLVMWLRRQTPNCVMYSVFTMIMTGFTASLFLFVTAITVDGSLAAHLHLRYQELVTHKRVVIVVILIWVFSILLPLLAFWSLWNVTLGLHTVIQFTCLGAVTICYYKIYRAVRCHSNQIHALKIHQVAPNGQSISVNSLRKSAISAFYVYLVFMVCYLPQNCSFVAAIFYGPLTAIKRVLVFTWTLTFVNSFLNPIVYCWKMRNIRRAVFIVLWRIFSVRKETVESCSYVSRTASYAN